MRINSGGTSSFTDSSGHYWSADQYYTGGTTYTNTATVTNTTVPQVYKTERYGQTQSTFQYNVPVPSGTYSVALRFAETYVMTAGKRLFSVFINGQQVLSNFDIYATAGGMNLSVIKTFTTTVSNGTLNITFKAGSVENPKINAIEITQTNTTSPSPSPVASPTPAPTATPAPVLSPTPTPVTTAANCTLYASASGSDGNSGLSASAPKTFLGAAKAANPGAVVCLLAGTYTMNATFYPPRSGTATAWITYKAYGNGAVNFVWNGGSSSDKNMFHFYNATFPNGPSYLAFDGLDLDGKNVASNGFFCQGSHHLRFTRNFIKNMGGAGIGSVLCDYLMSDHNTIYHNGYNGGWTSGISYNSNQFYDSFSGFHNIVSNNVIAGEFDSSTYHSDGNGIIMDLSNRTYTASSANTPPALIINNVVYGNGGRCIINFTVTNIYVINNTCYKNDLDLSMNNPGGITSNQAHDEWFVNNIVVSWHSVNHSFESIGGSYNLHWYKNMYYGASPNFTVDTTQFFNANPLFLNPPFVDPSAGGQYATILSPLSLGTGLMLQSTSPAFGKGLDPSTLSGLDSNIVAGLKKYIYTDIRGVSRPAGGPFTLGAYQ